MAISESQLDTWSHQGSVTQSSLTYATIKRALEDSSAAYARNNFEIFLQGSYGNDTNIYAESDVDVVIRLDSTFFYDVESLAAPDQNAFHAIYPGAAEYPYSTFKKDVAQALQEYFPGDLSLGSKAIKIQGSSSRRNADVVAACEWRRYVTVDNYVSGICFFDADGHRIVNYPGQHSENCTAKHQATSQRFKPTVRVFKNIKKRLVELGRIDSKLAPSYFVEGLLYNVPNNLFHSSRATTLVNALNWLMATDRNAFVCANEEYYLLRDAAMCWPPSNCHAFLNALVQFWNSPG